MKLKKSRPEVIEPKYPGVRTASDGSEAIVSMETAGSEAAGAYPITPSTQMGEGWAAAVAAGRRNVNGRKLIFFEPEGEHAAAAVTAGMSMTGLRSANFSSGQGIAYMHESLYPAVGKRLTYVLNMACRAMTKHALNVHAGHDDYHAIDDTGFFQLFAKNVQEAADLNLVAHRIAELSLNPGVCAQDGFLTSHVIESLLLPERDLVKEYLGDPSDIIESPTPAQRMVFGETRRRIPEMFDFDYPTMLGVVQNQDSYAQGVAAQRPFYFEHVRELTDRAMEEFYQLTGRRYARASGYRLEDADYVILGQGSMVWNAEAVADYLRETRGLAVGVLNVTMFRPFPADRITELLRGKKAVTVLERTDQPLAVDLPMAREIRAAMSKAVENGHSQNEKLPHPGLAAIVPHEVPELYSGVFGLGSRDLQPGDLVAAVENMLPGGAGKRQFYLSIDFIRQDTHLPKLQIWQERLIDAYPDVSGLGLQSAGDINLMPKDSVSIRIHSVGGWGAITMGKNLAMTAFELLGWHVKANPKYGSEKKGQPTTFYATLAKTPIRLNSELKHVDVVLSPDPNVFRHSNPLQGLSEGGMLVIQSNVEPATLWESFPVSARREVEERKLRVYLVDAFRIASDEASEPELRYRMQGAAFMGSFFRVAGLMEKEGLDEKKLFDGIRKQIEKKFGHLGQAVVEDNVRVIRRGFDEVKLLEHGESRTEGAAPGRTPQMPDALDGSHWREGIGNPGRFWEQVAFLYKSGDEPIADPFAAISAIPAATSTIRDMTDVRFEVPEFVAEKCTGCSQCWVVCPDAAIPGVVNTVEELVDAGIAASAKRGSFDKLRQIRNPLAAEARRILKGVPFHGFADVLSQAYKGVVDRLGWDAERRAQLDEEFAPVFSALSDFPLAKTQAFYDLPESREKGTGGLLSVTVSPDACKGCNLCVEVCPDQALVTVQQDHNVVDKLRRNWKLWEHLPDTDDRYVNVANLDEGIGVLSSLLLKKDNYRTMFGGDGACMGCGEKTGVHLLLSAVTAVMQPRVQKHVKRLEGLIARLDQKARGLLASDADLDKLVSEAGKVDIALEESKRADVLRIAKMKHELEDLHWRYTEGPSGKGRAMTGFSNSTGCSSVWGSTYPYNPYPFPWTNHLFQDAPSIAIGLFEGHMRKMADGFVAVRRAELELSGAYDPQHRRGLPERFRLAPVRRRGVPPLSADLRRGRRRRHARHRFSERVAPHGVGQAHPHRRPRYPGVLEHRWAGLHERLHRPGLRHGHLRQGPARKGGDPQGDGADRDGPSRDLRAPVLAGPPFAHARGHHPGTQQPATVGVHPALSLPARARSRRQPVHPRRQALARVPRLSLPRLRSRRGRHPCRLHQPRRQSRPGRHLADLRPQVPGRRREGAVDGAAADHRRLGGDRGALQEAFQGSERRAQRGSRAVPRVPRSVRGGANGPGAVHLQHRRQPEAPPRECLERDRQAGRRAAAALARASRDGGAGGSGGERSGARGGLRRQASGASRWSTRRSWSTLRAQFPQFVARRMAEGLLRAGNGGITVADLLAKAESTPGLDALEPRRDGPSSSGSEEAGS